MNGHTFTRTRKIILAIDGSDHAMTAVNLLRNLPLPESCKITVLSVLIPRNAQYYATIEKLLEQTRILFKSQGREVETHLLSGYPAEQIIQYANKQEPDLVVLGAKGLRGSVRILLGGVAQQVVHHVNSPVLIVRAPHTQVRRVILVTDGSEHSNYAVQYLGNCPLPADAAVTIVHVLPPEMTSEMLLRSWPYGIDVIPPMVTSDVEESLVNQAKGEETRGKTLLEKTLSALSDLNIEANSELLRGDAATEILNYAQDNQIDMIIAGSRGLSQVQSWLLGSVSSKLTHYASCSVLVVKKPGP